jgi:hypothetical protein
MKNIILTITAILSFTLGFAQTNFKWEKVDSISKTKAQIYSDTKMFIAEYWKSAQNVIQNDDKEAGMILVKGLYSKDIFFLLNAHNYTYSYTVKFLMKEGKYKIIIENVNCVSATCNGTIKWPLVEPTENTSESIGGVPSKRLAEIMVSLKTDLQGIVDSYEKYIKTPSSSNGDW